MFHDMNAFMPHGMCYLWRPDVLALHVISDSLIALAYFSIPFTLIYFVRKRKDLEFHWMFQCFAVFIVACGTTHLMEIWVIWHPTYWLSGTIKAITALASVPTAILLARLIPDALRLPSPSMLKTANTHLEREIADRKRAQDDVQRLNEELERRVMERTQQLEQTNRDLLQEIRERERAEQALRESEQLTRAILDNSTAIVYVKDVAGRFLLVNRRFEEIFHVTRQDIIGKTDHDIFPQANADAFRSVDEQVMAAGVAQQMEEVAPQDDGMHTYVSIKCPLHDSRGTLYGLCGISTDITERKASERRQQVQLTQLDLLNRITHAIAERQDLSSMLRTVIRRLEHDLPIDFGCVCLYDPTTRSLTVACVGVKNRGLATELTLGGPVRIQLHRNGLLKCAQGQLVYEPDLDTAPFPFPQRLVQAGLHSLVAAPLLAEGNLFGVLLAARQTANGFSSDECEFLKQLSEHVALAANQAQVYAALQQAYDELRQTQQAVMEQERLRVLGQMASGIAHDINNAISPVSLYTETLLEQETGLSVEGRHQVATIQHAIEGVAETVARIREFYRPREPQSVMASINLNQLVEQVVQLTRARWSDIPQQKGIHIELRTDLDTELPKIEGAKNEIRDALTNVIFNAVDAMPDGGILTLRTHVVTQENHDPIRQVCVEVSDTGVGMDGETQRRCLEPFFTSKGERGTGLGLAMVYGMAQRHGAELRIVSEPDQGTTVRILFTSSDSFTSTAVFASKTRIPLKPLRILIVDDDSLVLESLRSTLQRDGHHITIADGGQAGIDAFATAAQAGTPFAIVITDLGMPHVDGRKVAVSIRITSPSTPIILITGWGQRLAGDNNLMPPVDRVLSKPPKLHELRRALAELTGQGLDLNQGFDLNGL